MVIDVPSRALTDASYSRVVSRRIRAGSKGSVLGWVAPPDPVAPLAPDPPLPLPPDPPLPVPPLPLPTLLPLPAVLPLPEAAPPVAPAPSTAATQPPAVASASTSAPNLLVRIPAMRII